MSALLRRFIQDCRDLWTLLTRGEPEDDPIMPFRLIAEMAKFPEEKIDWFLWECEQIQLGGYAIWFDHWRYEGERWAYAEPTESQRRANWNASLARAVQRHGAAVVRDKGQRAAAHIVGTKLEDDYWRQPDPVSWVMKINIGG